jgi:hypothetical protein
MNYSVTGPTKTWLPQSPWENEIFRSLSAKRRLRQGEK